MAHVGSFVPAESATIGITDKILTRLQTCDTVSNVNVLLIKCMNHVNMKLLMVVMVFTEPECVHDRSSAGVSGVAAVHKAVAGASG